jgi:hypothetical protein
MTFGRARILPLLLISFSTVAASEHLDFRTRILPILTKAGCNTGACHGAAAGQGGLKLSLLGYDPARDYRNLTRELGGRRVDLDAPPQVFFYARAKASSITKVDAASNATPTRSTRCSPGSQTARRSAQRICG